MSEAPLVEASLMAIAQINQSGGVLGRQIEPIVEDGGSNPADFERQARKLIQQDQVVTVFGCGTSVSRKAVLPVFEQFNALLWYPMPYEGLECSTNIFYTGTCPNQQVEPAVNWLLQNRGKQFYLLGSDCVFSRTTNKLIASQLKQQGGTIVGEDYVPLETKEFAEIITTIKQARPDVVFNTLDGESNLAFYRQYQASGITADEMPILTLSVTEAELQQIGEAAVGHYACWSYFQNLDTSRNRRFVEDFQAKYGADRIISNSMEAAYTQVYLWKQAVEQAQSFEVERVRVAAYGQSFEAPTGLVTIEPNHHVGKACRIGQFLANGQFAIAGGGDFSVKPLPWLGVEQANFNASGLAIELLAEISQKLWQLEQKSQNLEAAMAQLHSEVVKRQRVEAVLRDSEAQLYALFAAMTDVVLVYDAQGRCLKIAPTKPAQSYQPTNELIGKTLHEVFEPLQADTFLGYIRKALSTQQAINFEYSLSIKEQSVWLAASISPISEDSVIWVARDITPAKRVEEEMWRTQTFLNSIVENLPNILFVKDAQNLKFVRINQAGEELFGYARNELIGKSDYEFFPPEQADFFIAKDREVLADRKLLDILEEPIQTKDKGLRILHTKKIPILDGSGKPQYLLGISEDITERKQAEKALQESEARLNLALKAAQMGIWDWNIVTSEVAYSDQLGPVFGLPPDNYHPTYKTFLDPVHPEDRKYVALAMTRAIREGADYAIEFRVIWPDGSLHWVGSKGQVYCDETGQPLRLVGVAMNITERKLVTEALRQSEERMRALLNAMPDRMFRHRVDGTYLDVKAQAGDLIVPAEMLIGRNLREFSMPQEIQQGLLTLLQVAVETGELQTYEHELEKADGIHTYEARIVKSGADEAVCIVRDITDRKQAEEALRQAEERYRSIFENTDEGLFQMTPDGQYLSANPALARIYGYKSPEELIADSTHINQRLYVDPQHRAQFFALLQTQDTLPNFESQVYRKDGRLIWISENTHVVRDAKGELLYYEGSVVDITKRKIWEEALRYQQQQTEQLLLNILPEPIAQRLQMAESTIADNFGEVTVLFADLVNFTEISAQIPPTKLVDMLNKIFSQFDQLAEKHGIEKIKTIGDAYMVVGGLPTPRSDHAEAIAEMALDMQQAITRFKQDDGEPFHLRIGINTGPVVAGVIGTKKFTYDLWGDTVNVASRMESQGVAGGIQVTTATYERLQDKYCFEQRGAIAIKGKGEMITYWLTGRNLCHLKTDYSQ